jgi:hypothetical protein
MGQKCPAPHHVQLDVDQAFKQVPVPIDHRAVKSPLPEGPSPFLAPVVALARFSGSILHQLTDLRVLFGKRQKMHMVARDGVVQQRHIKLVNRLSDSFPAPVPMNGKTQEKITVMASVRQVIDVSRQDLTVGPWHKPTYPAGAVSLQSKSTHPNLLVRLQKCHEFGPSLTIVKACRGPTPSSAPFDRSAAL